MARPAGTRAASRRRPTAGRLGRVLVAAGITGGSGLPAGTTRRHPTWGLTFLTAGTGRYRDARHDEPIGAGIARRRPPRPSALVRRRPPVAGTSTSSCSTAPSSTSPPRRGALSPEHPLVHGLPVRRWAARFAAFDRARPAHESTAATPRRSTCSRRCSRRARSWRAPARDALPDAGPAGSARSVELLEGDLDRAPRPARRRRRGRPALRDVAAPVPGRDRHEPVRAPVRAPARSRHRPARAHRPRRARHRRGDRLQRRAAPHPTLPRGHTA